MLSSFAFSFCFLLLLLLLSFSRLLLFFLLLVLPSLPLILLSLLPFPFRSLSLLLLLILLRLLLLFFLSLFLQIVCAVSREIFYLRVSGDGIQVTGSKEMPHEVACLDIASWPATTDTPEVGFLSESVDGVPCLVA